MTSIAVFDFDRTIINDDSDATIIRKLEEARIAPEWNAESESWTPYMGYVFQHAYSAGMTKKDILDAIASMKPTPNIGLLFRMLHACGWHILIISDANSVFVQHWLETHNLMDCVTNIITNRAFWRDDRLFIEPCMKQSVCPRCPSNLCKSVALAQWLRPRDANHSVIYVGDGNNDYCPATNLSAQATLYPRIGYTLHKKVIQTFKSSKPEVKARIVPWDDCDTIIEDLFPGQSKEY